MSGDVHAAGGGGALTPGSVGRRRSRLLSHGIGDHTLLAVALMGDDFVQETDDEDDDESSDSASEDNNNTNNNDGDHHLVPNRHGLGEQTLLAAANINVSFHFEVPPLSPTAAAASSSLSSLPPSDSAAAQLQRLLEADQAFDAVLAVDRAFLDHWLHHVALQTPPLSAGAGGRTGLVDGWCAALLDHVPPGFCLDFRADLPLDGLRRDASLLDVLRGLRYRLPRVTRACRMTRKYPPDRFLSLQVTDWTNDRSPGGHVLYDLLARDVQWPICDRMYRVLHAKTSGKAVTFVLFAEEALRRSTRRKRKRHAPSSPTQASGRRWPRPLPLVTVQQVRDWHIPPQCNKRRDLSIVKYAARFDLAFSKTHALAAFAAAAFGHLDLALADVMSSGSATEGPSVMTYPLFFLHYPHPPRVLRWSSV